MKKIENFIEKFTNDNSDNLILNIHLPISEDCVEIALESKEKISKIKVKYPFNLTNNDLHKSHHSRMKLTHGFANDLMEYSSSILDKKRINYKKNRF